MMVGDSVEPPPEDILKFKKFLYEDCNFMRKNYYILKRFSLDIHLQLNKDPKTNLQPAMLFNMVFGGQFDGLEERIIGAADECFDFKLQFQQLQALMKFLDFSGKYTKFQKGVL